MTDQDMLGPCEPGTAINLDGIVWNESKGGTKWTRNVIKYVNDFVTKTFTFFEHNLAWEKIYGNIAGLFSI